MAKGKVKIDFEQLRDRVDHELREIVCENIPDGDAIERAKDAVVRWFDDNTNTGVFEPIDGPVLRFTLGLVIPWVLKGIRAEACR